MYKNYMHTSEPGGEQSQWVYSDGELYHTGKVGMRKGQHLPGTDWWKNYKKTNKGWVYVPMDKGPSTSQSPSSQNSPYKGIKNNTPYVSKEYQEEMEFNSQQNKYPSGYSTNHKPTSGRKRVSKLDNSDADYIDVNNNRYNRLEQKLKRYDRQKRYSNNYHHEVHKVNEPEFGIHDEIVRVKDRNLDNRNTLDYKIDAAKDKASNLWNSAKDKVSEAYESGKKKAGEAYESGKQKVSEAYESGKKKVGEAYESGRQKVSDAYESGKNKAGEAYESGKEKVSEAYESGKKQLEETFDDAKKQFSDLVNSGKAGFSKLWGDKNYSEKDIKNFKSKADNAYNSVKEQVHDLIEKYYESSAKKYMKAHIGHYMYKPFFGPDPNYNALSENFKTEFGDASKAYLSAKINSSFSNDINTLIQTAQFNIIFKASWYLGRVGLDEAASKFLDKIGVRKGKKILF